MLTFRSDAIRPDIAEIIETLDGRELVRLGGPCTARVLGVHSAQDEHWVQVATSLGPHGDTDTVLRLSSLFGLRRAVAALEAVDATAPVRHPRLIDLRTHLS